MKQRVSVSVTAGICKLSAARFGGVVYALIGGMIGIFNGIFVDWPPPVKKPSIFSWKGCLIGLIIAFCTWFMASLVIGGASPERWLVNGAILAPTGGVAGGLWRFINWSPPDKLSSGKKAPLFSWKGCLIGLVSAFLLGLAVDLISGYTPVVGLIQGGMLAPAGAIAGGLWRFFKEDPSSSGEKAPLFSGRGCLIGLVSAFLLGLVFVLFVDNINKTILVLEGKLTPVTYITAVASHLGGSLGPGLIAASVIAPAGAVMGGISRYIFWRANELEDGKLGGIGAIVTLVGFLVQLVPPLLSVLNIAR